METTSFFSDKKNINNNIKNNIDTTTNIKKNNDNNIESNFENLNLNENLLQGIYLYGFIKPSKIQITGIKSINTGKDCILQSQSGTGKTATYLLGILNRIDQNENKCQGIILTPTHELSEQVYNVAIQLAKFTTINIVKCIGGTNINETKDLIKTSHLIIGTIGRVNHMITEKKINTHTIKFIVLDEADIMLEDGLNDKLKFIYDKSPENIQCIMISATMSFNVLNISKRLMFEPYKILLKNSEIAVELISQFYVHVDSEEFKFETLLDLYSIISTSQAIIFANTIKKVDWLKEKLEGQNFEITYIHGKMLPKEREEIIKEFRDGKTRILLTTDLLARGIDIPDVNLVINYDLPETKETYIHRIGRCGRYNKKGVAITMVKMNDASDNKLFNKMKYNYRIKIDEMPDNIEKYL
jgi:superfamily II DNA/RNA helicase